MHVAADRLMGRMIDESYLTFLRTKSCALCPAELAEPHHIRNRAWREVKRNDATCAPLCRECHELVHTIGLAATLNRRGITIWRFVETITGHLVEFFELRNRAEVGI